MKESNDIEIMQVKNGFIVRPAVDIRNNSVIDTEAVRVFQSLKALKIFLEQHFTHRDDVVDQPSIEETIRKV